MANQDELKRVCVELTPWILLLQKYYQGHLTNIEFSKWQEIIEALKAEPLIKDKIELGFIALEEATKTDFEEMKYSFNQLFIGPDKLLAPPYESCYRNPDRLVLQEETMQVRRIYKRAGVQISSMNVESDDFIAFELEFILLLFSDLSDEKLEILHDFLEQHLFVWYFDHILDIRKGTDNPICLGMADILEGVMQECSDTLLPLLSDFGENN